MFKVISDGLVVTVYSVRTNENNDIEFLMYFDNQWKWMYADFWKPYIERS